ncbi:hypothetical protein PC129_g21431 [Phytophthora cactorum]|uniref:Uncharacterized protein n=1 Tax=Phytophthora cactorum TaxID=29920 RepID=A0A8T0Y8I8_9STRA|nr:hypothetical protein PC113_g22093 [Phytophthora cactorum]KAG2875424.1 hypothetical protein PC114_g24735 [Phytophthora cactorum]KAG2882211.1 hypothetical protein PC115_g22007 [Phytophthora cactorum]KAG3128031.1 hypothetical protein C6341_g24739 [Phytophthora cactorum]KAG3207527.1 hypothetical protein PC129_g21431 [Phytophthora cactorum]
MSESQLLAEPADVQMEDCEPSRDYEGGAEDAESSSSTYPSETEPRGRTSERFITWDQSTSKKEEQAESPTDQEDSRVRHNQKRMNQSCGTFENDDVQQGWSRSGEVRACSSSPKRKVPVDWTDSGDQTEAVHYAVTYDNAKYQQYIMQIDDVVDTRNRVTFENGGLILDAKPYGNMKTAKAATRELKAFRKRARIHRVCQVLPHATTSLTAESGISSKYVQSGLEREHDEEEEEALRYIGDQDGQDPLNIEVQTRRDDGNARNL